jgi:hypothetical protein
MKRKIFVGLIALAMSANLAHANTVIGDLWLVPDATAQNAVPASVPGTTPDVVFQVNSPFDFSGTNVTVAAWLASSSAFNIVENTAGTLASLMSNGTTSTLLNFTGNVSVTNGDIFTVTHDDGLSLIIGGLLVIDEPGPTSPVTTLFTYTGPTGTFPFQLVYGECCSGPAELQISLALESQTPLPGALPLFVSGLGGLGLLGWRRKKKAAKLAA